VTLLLNNKGLNVLFTKIKHLFSSANFLQRSLVPNCTVFGPTVVFATEQAETQEDVVLKHYDEVQSDGEAEDCQEGVRHQVAGLRVDHEVGEAHHVVEQAHQHCFVKGFQDASGAVLVGHPHHDAIDYNVGDLEQDQALDLNSRQRVEGEWDYHKQVAPEYEDRVEERSIGRPLARELGHYGFEASSGVLVLHEFLVDCHEIQDE